MKHLRVKCLAQGHTIETIVPLLRVEKHHISLKILHQAVLETARQAATSAKRHAQTIASCPSITACHVRARGSLPVRGIHISKNVNIQYYGQPP